ncbi:MAG: dipeptide epimerase [Nitrososphaerota archaeon]|nr:dipeptide epimerase [Candidatus Bathyarchaeota archaeon]MDW8048119.1 dipeptide epimerase [Nitrososphaerota archaeon]
MGIQRIEVYNVSLDYREPFRIAPGTAYMSKNIIVKIVTDYRVVGWGEASPSRRLTGETPETVIQTLDLLAPKMIGACPLRIEWTLDMMDSTVARNPAAKAAVDMALHDIFGKTVGKPLFMLLGGYRTEVLTDITLGIRQPQEMAKDAIKAVRSGFNVLKVKVGVNPTEDVERIRLIREAVGEDLQLRIDANGGWTPKQAVEVLNRIERFNIQFAEQPVPPEDLEGMVEVRRKSPIPIMADESVCSAEDALRVIELEAADMINIKLMKCGGIAKARKIAAITEAADIPCMIGCTGESEVGIAAATHLAAALKNIRFADLDSDLLLRDKLVKRGGTKITRSRRIPSRYHGPGIMGVDIGMLGEPVRVYM